VGVQFRLENLDSFDPTTQEGTGFNLQALSTSPKNKSQLHCTHIELGATAEPKQLNCLLGDLGERTEKRCSSKVKWADESS
jgi:hypothetical protein